MKDLFLLIAANDPQGAAVLLQELKLLGMKLGLSITGDSYVMFKLRDKKIHPEVGVGTGGWLFGIGYDYSDRWSLDIYIRKDWDFRGKPEAGIGLSTRF